MVNQLQEQIDRHLKTLSMGLVQNSGEQIYRAHRELYNHGEMVLPIVEEQILGYSWADIKYGSQLNLLSGLLSLINDIDENRAKNVGEKIRKAGCSSVVDQRITSITTFTLNEFNAYEIRGLKIFQSKSLEDTPYIKRKLGKWLAIVPKKDVEQIDRIYIIPESNEDHRGTYMPILCSIMIEWDLPVSFYNPLSWLFLLQIEKTLYHEIGHHVNRHTFGQDPVQEKEANQYAALLLRQSHPIFRIVVRTVRGIFGKRSNPKEGNNEANGSR